MPKCQSPCVARYRGLGNRDKQCNPPFCTFINKKRTYCTMNRKKYTLDKTKCEIVAKSPNVVAQQKMDNVRNERNRFKELGKRWTVNSKQIAAAKQQAAQQKKQNTLKLFQSLSKKGLAAKRQLANTIRREEASKKRKVLNKFQTISKNALIDNRQQMATAAAAAARVTATTLKKAALKEKFRAITKKVVQKQKYFLNKKIEKTFFFEYANILCPDTGVCIALKRQNGAYIKQLFNRFTDFSFLNFHKIKRIGAASVNGFVLELEYTRKISIQNTDQIIKAHAVLKSSSNPQSDNLLYEYTVGRFINRLIYKYPCFVETYGLFSYRSKRDLEKIRDFLTPVTAAASIQALILKKDHRLSSAYETASTAGQDSFMHNMMLEACINGPQHFAILIQHISNCKTLHEMLLSSLTPELTMCHFIEDDLLSVYLQIYIPLSWLRDTFTHHDLHMNNVLLYEPVKGKYMKYIYNYMDGYKVEFRSKYLVKLIDYGHCYFAGKNFKYGDSRQFISELVKIQGCNSSKGLRDNGFWWLQNQSYLRNVSQDLLMLDVMKLHVKSLNKKSELYKSFQNLNNYVFKLIHYPGGRDKVPSLEASGGDDKINNVKDAADWLIELNNADLMKSHNQDIYSAKTDCLYTINVYQDPSKFMQISR